MSRAVLSHGVDPCSGLGGEMGGGLDAELGAAGLESCVVVETDGLARRGAA